MALAIESEILAALFRTRDKIRARMQQQGINASGRTSASIDVRQGDGHLTLYGGTSGTHGVPGPAGGGMVTASDTAPIPTLELGRPGGNVPRGFYYIIKEWSREKGISFQSERERSTFAYFVARKIARAGTRRHQEPENVYSEPVTEAIKEIREALSRSINGAIHAHISRLKGVE